MMPRREQVLERAKQLFFESSYQRGSGSTITPEDSELLESGFYSAALSELMRDNARAETAEWKNYNSAFEEPKKNEQSKGSDGENFEKILDVDALLRSGTVIFGGSGCGKSTLAKAIVGKLSNRAICYVIDPSRSWLTSGFDVREIYDDSDSVAWLFRNTVFDCCALSPKKRVNFVNLFAGALLDGHMTNPLRQSEVLVLEEAELYIPNNGMRARALENVLALVAMGRNFGLRFIALSQVPSMIDKLCVKLCEQKFFGRLSEPNDLNYLKKLVGKEWTEQLKGLGIGEFLSENKGKVQRFKLGDKPKTPATSWFNYEFKNLEFLYTKTL